ncbi:hypothetical protein DAI22_07g108401 [Oryza sativa Japonica Group]|nr:hypothetical protein DAI22_07g108401 [Oryza sativa Japonica Group]
MGFKSDAISNFASSDAQQYPCPRAPSSPPPSSPPPPSRPREPRIQVKAKTRKTSSKHLSSPSQNSSSPVTAVASGWPTATSSKAGPSSRSSCPRPPQSQPGPPLPWGPSRSPCWSGNPRSPPPHLHRRRRHNKHHTCMSVRNQMIQQIKQQVYIC